MLSQSNSLAFEAFNKVTHYYSIMSVFKLVFFSTKACFKVVVRSTQTEFYSTTVNHVIQRNWPNYFVQMHMVTTYMQTAYSNMIMATYVCMYVCIYFRLLNGSFSFITYTQHFMNQIFYFTLVKHVIQRYQPNVNEVLHADNMFK